jgi:hypothetical protein
MNPVALNNGSRMTTDITTLAAAVLSLPGGLPALITTAGERTAWHFVDFFTATLRNPHTREAYARAVGRFLTWCEGRGLRDLRALTPVVVAAYKAANIAADLKGPLFRSVDRRRKLTDPPCTATTSSA